jgi:hypothetical protein
MMRWVEFKCGNVIDIGIYLKNIYNLAWIHWKCVLEMDKLKKKQTYLKKFGKIYPNKNTT